MLQYTPRPCGLPCSSVLAIFSYYDLLGRLLFGNCLCRYLGPCGGLWFIWLHQSVLLVPTVLVHSGGSFGCVIEEHVALNVSARLPCICWCIDLQQGVFCISNQFFGPWAAFGALFVLLDDIPTELKRSETSEIIEISFSLHWSSGNHVCAQTAEHFSQDPFKG